MAKKCKPFEIYKSMCDVFGEAYFNNKNNVYKWTKHEPEWTGEFMEWKHTDSQIKKNFRSHQPVKNIISVLGHKKTYDYWFPWKDAAVTVLSIANNLGKIYLIYCDSVGWGIRIHWLHHFSRVRRPQLVSCCYIINVRIYLCK